jgi:NAD(P)H-flavin reductase
MQPHPRKGEQNGDYSRHAYLFFLLFRVIWQVSLIYENESPEDILLKERLDNLAQSHPNFKVHGS